ncbi:L,D-transpeptidase family protein [Enterococcus asini]|uniref:L,D-transpeptidase family protein n=1 Tax=Enterococcus asini TaxID=57732 RepID=UPI00288EF4E2|nr:L,D-transpeptidase family protein [Enterococcus asini]MDT2756577.1 L,D-transpeptidase family protein [Enterococcus asini]
MKNVRKGFCGLALFFLLIQSPVTTLAITEGTNSTSEEATSASLPTQTSTLPSVGETVTSQTSSSTEESDMTVSSSTEEETSSSSDQTEQQSSEELVEETNRFQLAYKVGTADWLYGEADELQIESEGDLKGLDIRILDTLSDSDESVLEFRGHYSQAGWSSEEFAGEEAFATTTNHENALEALELRLKENLQDEYTIYYQVYTPEFGWLGWAKNGESAGSTGFGYEIEKINIRILPVTDADLTNDVEAFKEQTLKAMAAQEAVSASVEYQAHVENIGWQNFVKDGATAGTTGLARQVEALSMKLNLQGVEGSIEYRSHIENLGWSAYSRDGTVSGTTGRNFQLEALQVRLVGEVAQQYDVYYRAHVQEVGWLGWAKNDGVAGTTGFNYRIEAYEVKLVKKGGGAPGNTNRPNIAFKQPNVKYSAHVEDHGWNLGTKSNGGIAGTTGQKKRIEAITVSIDNLPMSGGVEYRAHGENYGWQSYRSNGAVAGTTGQKLRIEAMDIRLTGEIAKHFDVYYRVHSENLGWLGWAKNGQHAGTSSLRYRVEAVQIVLFLKGHATVSQNGNSYVTHKVHSIKNISRYVRVLNNSGSAFSNEPAPYASKNTSVARFKGYMGRAIKEADTTSGRYYFLVAPGGNLGWVKASETENVQSQFWMYNTDGPFPSLNVANLNITVSVSQQRVRIRSGSRTLYTMLCSTGLGLWPNNLSTPYGNFRIQAERGDSFWYGGSGGAFYRSYHGHGVYLFHTVPIAFPGTTTVFNQIEGAKLGQRASHGCIRLSVPDARWFYYNIPYNTPVQIYY